MRKHLKFKKNSPLGWAAWITFSIVGLILLLLVIFHMPFVQGSITQKASNYLSSKLNSKVTIDRINLSLWNGVGVRNLQLYDPEGELVLSADRLDAYPNLIRIVLGDLIINSIGLEGVRFHLINTENGLNTDFVVEAFGSGEPSPTEESQPFAIEVGRITLENIDFRYTDQLDITDLSTDIGKFQVTNLYFSTLPNYIGISDITLENSDISLVYPDHPDEPPSGKLPPLDLNSGFKVNINNIGLSNNQLELHLEHIAEPDHFQPDHLSIKNNNLQLLDLIITTEQLSFRLDEFSASMPGFDLEQASVGISIKPDELKLSGLSLSSGNSGISSELEATFSSWELLPEEITKASVKYSLEAMILPESFEYFLSDSLSEQFRNWPLTVIDLSGSSDVKGITIDQASMTVEATDQLQIAGRIDHTENLDTIPWWDVTATGKVGPNFIKVISQLSKDLTLPENIQFTLVSTGYMEKFTLDGEILSPNGSLALSGSIGITQQGIALDQQIEGKNLDLGSILSQNWLGATSFDFHLEGATDGVDGLNFGGDIGYIHVAGTRIDQIDLDGKVKDQTLELNAVINDPDFNSSLAANVGFADSIKITSELSFQDLRLDSFVERENMLISGSTRSDLLLAPEITNGWISVSAFQFDYDTVHYRLDSLRLKLKLSPAESNILLVSDHLAGSLHANFDLSLTPDILAESIKSYGSVTPNPQTDNHRFDFELLVRSEIPLEIIDDRFKRFNGLEASGRLNQAEQLLELLVETKDFSGFGLSVDSLGMDIRSGENGINSNLAAKHLGYNDTHLGNLNFDAKMSGDSIYSKLLLADDSLTLIYLTSFTRTVEDGMSIHLDSLTSFNKPFQVSENNRIIIAGDSLHIENLEANSGEIQLKAAAERGNYTVELKNADLKELNYYINIDSSSIINHGKLNASVGFSNSTGLTDMNMDIDSLVLGDSPAITIEARAKPEGNSIPVEFTLNSTTNKLDISGVYNSTDQGIDGQLAMDLQDLQMFQFLFKDQLENLDGMVTGSTQISGTINAPLYTGSLRFKDVSLTTSKPRATFDIRDETLLLDNGGVVLDEFTIYDKWANPLVLNGKLRTQDYKTFNYDLEVLADKYLLVNNPSTEEYQLRGNLVIGSRLKLTGTEKNTRIDADIIIRDTTDLSYVLPRNDLELLSSEGIVEFVDPEIDTDSIQITKSPGFYDSLMATLPSFNLKSKVTLEEHAIFRVIMDSRSGDYIEVAGTAALDLSIDRSGNTQLEGSYVVSKGVYKLSFYDLVKKQFDIAPGSSVIWTGNPEDGALDIKAIHRISTSSVGLIGHEIGENERELYRRALPYQVGIIIQGTMDKPEVSFALDLPQEEKTNYPVLANKLERLTQPEFESELNKQVFGLLVLGGFIPESSASDIDQSLIATTALSNSVNNILASQLNRFAGQLVKGVDINVGLQSYSDFTAGSSQTRTAMDFRVTKRMMDDRLSIEVGGGMDINAEQSGRATGTDNFRGDITVIYDLTESGTKKLKMFNNETYDIIYHEIRNTGISLIFIKDFDKESAN